MLYTLRSVLVAMALLLASMMAVAAPVDINSASAQELSEAMVGVGLTKAEAIVTYRESHGAYKSIEDLVAVKGIGSKTLEKNRDKIYVPEQQ